MREIKFRGLREEFNPALHDSTWKVGNLLNANSIGEVGYDLAHYEFAKVKPETVGEFTGLNDKNGKEIWEGDILKLANNETVKVVFKSGRFMGIRKNKTHSNSTFYWIYSEVIGNIHEAVTPQLA